MTETNGEIRDDKGRFGVGNPGKPKGAVVKVSVKVRESIVNFLESNIDKIQEDFDTLKPRERLQFVSEILAYATPKLSAVKTENETKLSGGINISWSEPELHNPENKGSNGVVQGSESRIQDHS